MRTQRDIRYYMDRLDIIRDLALIDRHKDHLFDRLVALVSVVLPVPVSLVSIVSGDYQFFTGEHGLPEPWKTRQRTPLSHSFCQHVVTTGEPLIIEDATKHPLVNENLAIPALRVISYLGVPLSPNGHNLGSLCAIDHQPRQWTHEEHELLTEFSKVVNTEINMRIQALLHNTLQEYLSTCEDKYTVLFDALCEGVAVSHALRLLRTFVVNYTPAQQPQ